jgi:hypothetical protein
MEDHQRRTKNIANEPPKRPSVIKRLPPGVTEIRTEQSFDCSWQAVLAQVCRHASSGVELFGSADGLRGKCIAHRA